MAKRLTSERVLFEWTRGKRKDSIEYYGRPSRIARDLWLYVLGIGKFHCKPGFNHQRQGNRVGHVFHYIHRGEMWHSLGEKTFRVGTGEACLMDMGTRFSVGNDTRQAVDLWWIYFDGKDVPRIRTELGVDRNPVFEDMDFRCVEATFRDLWKLQLQKPPAYEVKEHALLNLILAELFACRTRQPTWANVIGHKEPLSDKVQMAVDFVERMYFKQIGIKHIAAAVHLNMHYLARRFRHEVGMAPIQYLNRFRIEQAKRMLVSNDKSISAVGRFVGIPDAQYFSRVFRKLAGESPQSYRAKMLRQDSLK